MPVDKLFAVELLSNLLLYYIVRLVASDCGFIFLAVYMTIHNSNFGCCINFIDNLKVCKIKL